MNGSHHSPLSNRAMCCLLLYSLFKVLLSHRCKEDTEAWEKPPSFYSLPSREGRRASCSLELSFTLSVFPLVLLWEALEEPL